MGENRDNGTIWIPLPLPSRPAAKAGRATSTVRLGTMMDNAVRKDSARVHPLKTCVHIAIMGRLSAMG